MQILKTNTDIFYLPKNGDAVCVTTNGMVKKDGKAVMGAGIAKQANEIFHVDEKLGNYLKQYGNRAFNLGAWKREDDRFNLLTFPTKHDWRDNSDIELIKTSAIQIDKICTEMLHINHCYLPPVGCGCGKLNWQEVSAVLNEILDDRYIAILR